jgi:hypothetical protein
MLTPESIPDPRALRQRAIALAMLDAILCPEGEYRYFHFDPHWAAGEQMASMKNGEGDGWFIHFGAFGIAIKGDVADLPPRTTRSLALEAQRQLPPVFASFLDEAALSMDAVSFCYWRGAAELAWSKLAAPSLQSDGSLAFLSILIDGAPCYADYADDYFEATTPLASIEHIYAHGLLSDELVRSLNPRMDLASAQQAAAGIGYPCTVQPVVAEIA